jgi:hypothetical protein
MRKKVLFGLIILIPMLLVGGYAYQYKGSFKIKTAESPDEVVKKFYAYVGEGGSSSLSEAYKLISTKHFTLTEDKFKGVVLNYPDDMKVDIIGSRVENDRAIVAIECKIPSTFGGDFVNKTEINLDLDEKSRSWKIDFTGETSTYEGRNT